LSSIKFIVSFLFVLNYLFANPNEILINSEKIMSIDEQLNDSTNSMQDITSSNLHDISEEDPYIKEKVIFLSYLKKDDRLYVNQIFKIDIKAIIAVENLSSIHTTFLNYKDIQILNPDSSWKLSGDSIYTNSYYIKVLNKDASMADIKVSILSDDGYEDSEILKAFQPKIIALKQDNRYSSVLAKEFNLISHKAKLYDDKSNIIVLEINASMANLEDFKLPYALRNGIDSIKTDLPYKSIYYFAIVPNNLHEFKFKYFDLNKNKFQQISFPIILKDTSVSTQTSLNPKKSKFLLYKSIALVVLALVIVLLYFRYKKTYILLIATLPLIYMGYLNIPISKVVLKDGMTLSILPTKNSTIFYKVQKPTEADILYENEEYIKVILPNKKIGWINKDAFKED